MKYEIELLEMKKNLRVSFDLPHKIGLPNFDVLGVPLTVSFLMYFH